MTLPGRVLQVLCLVAASAIAAPVARAADPTTAQCVAASESSLALGNQHKLRDARDQVVICSAGSCPAEIREECVRRVGELNATIPTIVFDAKDTAGNDLAAVKVTMDGQTFAERLDGTALSLDPGEHTFVFETAGQPPVQKRLVLHEGEKDRHERVAFGVPSVAATPEPASASLVASSSTAPPSGNSGGLGTQRILAIVSACVGVVGLGLGIGYGLEAMSKHSDANSVCSASAATCPDSNGVNLWNEAVSAGNVSTVGFIVSAVGLAGGAALWFTAKPGSGEGSEIPRTQVGLGLGTLQFKGSW